MALAEQQLVALNTGGDDTDLTILLSHHPLEWLDTKSRANLNSALSRVPHLHLCGHVHKKQAGSALSFGQHSQKFCFVAGALHDEETTPMNSDYHGEHGYSVGAIRILDGKLQIGWSPRVYVPELDSVRVDSTRFDLDKNGYAWAEIHKK
jgi:hypothetical protein